MKNNGQNFKVVDVHLEDTVEDVDPPPPDLKSDFENMQDWLAHICDGQRPEKAVTRFELGLFESRTDSEIVYVLYLAGINVVNHSYTVDYRPSNMYFRLPLEYSSLDSLQVRDKLVTEAVNFTTTKRFQSSFLAQAQTILFDGKAIWNNIQ